MGSQQEKRAPVEEGLHRAMQGIDSQIARAMSRTPAERAVHGVQKWEPFAERIERTCAFVLDSLGENSVTLDSVLVLAQAFAKALMLATEDLGEEGLGEVRSKYALAAAESLARDAERVRGVLEHRAELC